MAEAKMELFCGDMFVENEFVFHVECVEEQSHDDLILSTIMHEWCKSRFEFCSLNIRFRNSDW